jgi:uncharacterized protein (UPF0548 family)
LFYLRPPSSATIEDLIALQEESGFSYPEVGASAGELPAGFNVDKSRALLGSGEAIWLRAAQSIREWQMFNMPWIHLSRPNSAIEPGTTVGVLVRHFGFYSLNFARIVYVVSEDGPVCRFGFAYGTLEEHSERGEERFMVEWNRSTDEVWYDILAFSRPNKTLAKLAYPLARMLQKKFAKGSKAAMLRATRCGEIH